MQYTPAQAAIVLKEINSLLAKGLPDDQTIHQLWAHLATRRAHALALVLQNNFGDTVQSGPFAGMRLVPAVMQGGFAPYLLGCYETELHPAFERLIASRVPRILNIGCSHGYYAVGLARRMPHVTVLAFDIDPVARDHCAAMAKLNNVQDRVIISGEFRGEDFSAYTDKPTFLLMDIEGAEKTLLDPQRYTALGAMPIVVELHDLYDPTISALIIDRFSATHEIVIVRNQAQLANIQFRDNAGAFADPFDCLILTWEMRDGPTPWAVMWPKTQ
jgi:hypothetical protein